MEIATISAFLIILISIVVQFAAAFIAFSLVEVLDRQRAWLLIALAIFLMALRRSITIIGLITGSVTRPPDIAAELVALATSVLMVIGLSKIAPLFKSIQQSRDFLEVHTEELEASTSELETVIYTISGDLHTPIQHIDGYADILLGQNIQKLDERVVDYLRRIKTESKRMIQLTNNMVRLSQANRGEMSRETINMSALVQEIAEQCRRGEPDRSVDFEITSGIFAEGDPVLIRNVIENLIRNAWKFTRNEPVGMIEFGVEDHKGKTVFYIRDNGVGFNPSLATRLFKPLGRLHSQVEYEGTGIGLATAARIVKRHGGRIWAESEPRIGATFYFTLQ